MASVVAGCGGGSGSNSNYVLPDVNGTSELTQTVDYRIPKFGYDDGAMIIVSSAGKDEVDSTVTDVDITANSRAASAKYGVKKKDDGKKRVVDHRCGMSESVARCAAELKAANTAGKLGKAALASKAVSKATYDDKPVGYLSELYHPTNSDTTAPTVIKVVNMIDNSDPDNQNSIHCNILSEVTGDEGSGEPLQPIATEEAARMIASVFDHSNPCDPLQPFNIGIYDRITEIFGHEWNSGPRGGRDGDVKVNIVLCSSGTMGEGLLGLVRFEDCLTTELAPTSNQGEYVYLNYEFLYGGGSNPGNSPSLFGTLSHEFFHLVQMNSKVVQDGTFPNLHIKEGDEPSNVLYELWERRTMGEGFAETAATLCGYGVNGAQTATQGGGAELYSYDAINKYLNGESIVTPESYGVTTYPEGFFVPYTEYATSDPYGMGHLFGLHLLRKVGQEKFAELTKSPYVGIENLEQVLGESCAQVLHHYNISLCASSLVYCPEQYGLPYIKLGAENYCRTSSETLPVAHSLPNISVYANEIAYDDEYNEQMIPWAAAPFYFIGGNGDAFTAKVVIPKNSRVNLIHMSPAGAFNTMY